MPCRSVSWRLCWRLQWLRLAGELADELFAELDAPVRRVAAKDTFVAYQPLLEDAILPQPEDLYRGILQLAEY